jgi:hypothetical protein
MLCIKRFLKNVCENSIIMSFSIGAHIIHCVVLQT